MRLFLCAIAILTMSFGAKALDGTNWSSDLEAAQAQATKDGKDVMILFTGSDWCPYCIKMAEAVFDQKSFLDAMKKDFALVVVDFPKKTQLGAAQLKLNVEAARKYGITAFPVVVLVGKDGRVFAIQQGYFDKGVDAYLAGVKMARTNRDQRDLLLMAAEKEEPGIKKGALESAALELMNQTGVFCSGKYFGYEDTVKDIVASDPENKNNLRITWDYYAMTIKAHDAYEADRYKEVIELVEGFLKTYPKNKALQQLYYIESASYDKLMDRDHEVEMLHKIIGIDPNSDLGQEATQILDALNGKQGEK